MAQFTITANVLNQHSFKLYLFPMRSSTLKRISYVTPRTKASPEEVQRILNKERSVELGKYIKEENNILPNAIVVSLNDEVKVNFIEDGKVATLTFPDEDEKVAYILDGQHRVAGFDYSDGTEFDLPIVALHNIDVSIRGKIFADINSKQVRVTDNLVLDIYYHIKALSAETSATMDVVYALNTNPQSPLKDKIKVLDTDKDTWLTNKKTKDLIAPYTQIGGVLHNKTPNQQATILIDYLKAIRNTWPEAWGDNKRSTLTKTFGLEVMFGAFGDAKHRCDLNEGRQYTEETFTRQLEALKGAKLQMSKELGGGDIDLNWRSGPFAILSNKVGRAFIRKGIQDVLVRADES
jgi:DGQHR domain-containing protein